MPSRTPESRSDFIPIDGGFHGAPHPADHVVPGKGLGTGSIVLMVVAAAAPLTVIAAGVPIALLITGSIAVPLFYVVAAVILLLFSVGFTRMSRYVKNAGAFYSYVKAGLGRVTGVGAATLALGSYFLLLVALYCVVGVLSANAFARFTGSEVPWWVCAGVAWAVVAVLGYRDIDLSAKVLGAVLVLEGLVVLVLDVAIIVQGGAEGLNAQPFFPPNLDPAGLGFGVMLAVLSFIGFEATAVFRHEAADPDRTIPRATFIAVILIGAFYAFSSWVVIMGAGVDGVWEKLGDDPGSLVFTLATTYVSPLFVDVLMVLVVTSIFACVLAFHNVIGRYLYTLGAQRILPARLGELNPRHRTPSFASGWLSAGSFGVLTIFVLTGSDPYTVGYTWFANTATLGLVLLMALTNVAVIAFFRRARTGQVWATLVAPVASLIGMVLVVAMALLSFGALVGSDLLAAILISLVVVLFLAGVVIAVRLRRRSPNVYESLREPSVEAPAELSSGRR